MKKIDADLILFRLIIFFSISIILQGIEIFNGLNKILIFLTVMLLVIRILKEKIKRKTLIDILILCVLYVFSFVFTQKKLDNINDIFYFGLWVLFFLYLKDNYKKFVYLIQNNTKFIFRIIVLWNCITIVSLLFPISYNNNWGGEFYFKSFSNTEHRFASTCVFIVVLNWIIAMKKNNIKYMLFSIVPIIGIYLSGARTYLGILVILILCMYYIICKNKRVFYLTSILLFGVLVVIIMITPMGKKFIDTTKEENRDFLATITNSRSTFWSADLDAFGRLSLLQQLVGNGYNFVYDVNESVVNIRIYAHNDIINILMTYGYIGVYLYLIVFLRYSEFVFKQHKCSKIIKYGYYFIWLFNASFNMVYTYIGATLAMPFLLYSLVSYSNIKKNNDKEK